MNLLQKLAANFRLRLSTCQPAQSPVYHRMMADTAKRMATLYAEKIGRPSEAKDKEANERKLREAQEETQWHLTQAEELESDQR